MVSIAQSWFDEGFAKGKAATAVKLLEEKVDIELVARITGYNISKIQELQEKINSNK